MRHEKRKRRKAFILPFYVDPRCTNREICWFLSQKHTRKCKLMKEKEYFHMKLLGLVLGMCFSPGLLDPISEGTQWPLALILIPSKVCQVKRYHWDSLILYFWLLSSHVTETKFHRPKNCTETFDYKKMRENLFFFLLTRTLVRGILVLSLWPQQ